jgi:hypothetical protein
MHYRDPNLSAATLFPYVYHIIFKETMQKSDYSGEVELYGESGKRFSDQHPG